MTTSSESLLNSSLSKESIRRFNAVEIVVEVVPLFMNNFTENYHDENEFLVNISWIFDNNLRKIKMIE